MVGQQIVHNTFSFGVYESLSRSMLRGVKGWLDPLRGGGQCVHSIGLPVINHNKWPQDPRHLSCLLARDI